MDINRHIQKLDLDVKSVTKIEQEFALSSYVYKLLLKDNSFLILKFFYNSSRFNREYYFLDRLKNIIPVPQIINKLKPEQNFQGAILMEYLEGQSLNIKTLTKDLAFEMGQYLATLHEIRTEKYGDLTSKIDQNLSKTPYQEMREYLEESINECKNVLEPKLLDKAIKYFDQHKISPDEFDGPCIIHRDYKPGNVIANNNIITGIIDWENSRSSFAQEDFLRMDRSIWNEDETSKKPFISGYASVRKLPNFENIMPILQMSKTLGTIGFTIARNTWQNRNKKIFEENLEYLKNFLN